MPVTTSADHRPRLQSQEPGARWWRRLRRGARAALVWRAGNALHLYDDGGVALQEMIDCIATAQTSIFIETYILDANGPGEALAKVLQAKAGAGVAVHLIVDGIGSFPACGEYLQALRDCGVAVVVFNPPWPWQAGFRLSALNHRTHRKLVIVDDMIAFIGGMNISSVYLSGSTTGRTRSDTPWRDTHARVTGEVVGDLAQAFAAQWLQQTGAPLPLLVPAHAARLPSADGVVPSTDAAIDAVTGVALAAAASPPGSRRNPLYRALLDAINLSTQEILLTTPYFVPTRRLLRALIQARRRGVRVALCLPADSDSLLVQLLSRTRYGALLRAGIEIYEYREAMLHAKTAVVDREWFSIGSSNMDWRSLIHNAELNLVGRHALVGSELVRLFERDIDASQRVELQRWRARGWRLRLLERLVRPLEYLA